MLEVKVTIEAPALTEALRHLAIVLEGNGKSGRSSAAPVAESQEVPSTHTPPAAEPAPMAEPEQTPPPASAPPVAAPTYKLEDLQRAMAPLFDAGKQKEVQEAVTNMGYATLFEIPAERYGALAATLRGLGAQI